MKRLILTIACVLVLLEGTSWIVSHNAAQAGKAAAAQSAVHVIQTFTPYNKDDVAQKQP